MDRPLVHAAIGGVNELVLEHIERFEPQDLAGIIDDVTHVFVEVLERR